MLEVSVKKGCVKVEAGGSLLELATDTLLLIRDLTESMDRQNGINSRIFLAGLRAGLEDKNGIVQCKDEPGEEQVKTVKDAMVKAVDDLPVLEKLGAFLEVLKKRAEREDHDE